MVQTSTGSPGTDSNRVSSARAVALFAQDTITLERWTLVPGVRVESIDFRRMDYGKSDPTRLGTELVVTDSTTDVVLPGMGASYRLDRESNLFAGVHRGFAPPGPGAADEVLPEESINYELGYRRSTPKWHTQVVGFFNDYDNLLGSDTVSSGGTGDGDQFNGGAARIWGVEAAVGGDLARIWNTKVDLPWSVSYTWTRSQFLTSFDTEFEGWGDRVERGDEMPYLPLQQLTLGFGVAHRRVSGNFNLVYVDEMRTEAGQGPIPENQRIDAYALLDFSASYLLLEDLKLFLQARNLTDEVYAVARRPAGLRPGLSRTVLVGVSWAF
jgi:Fe(3+) dicitrate transport protein